MSADSYVNVGPIDCVCCGMQFGNMIGEFCRRTAGGEDPKHVLDEFLGTGDRPCCRAAILTSHDSLRAMQKYPTELTDADIEQSGTITVIYAT